MPSSDRRPRTRSRRLAEQELVKRREGAVARHRRHAPAPRRRHPRGWRPRLPDRPGGHRRGDRHRRRAPRVRHAAPGRDLPAPRRAVPGQGLDHVRRVALVEEADPDYYTQARDITDIVIVNLIDHRTLGDAELCFGDVEVTNQVVGFVRKLVANERDRRRAAARAAAGHPADPRGLVDAPRAADRRGRRRHEGARGRDPRRRALRDRVVAAWSRPATAGTSAASPRRCIRTRGCTTIFVYDGYPGGAGIAERGYQAAERWLRATARPARATARVATAARPASSVPEMRQRQRTPGQGRRRGAHPDHARWAMMRPG